MDYIEEHLKLGAVPVSVHFCDTLKRVRRLLPRSIESVS